MCPECGEPEVDAYGTCLHCGYGIDETDRLNWAEQQGVKCEKANPPKMCEWPDCECKSGDE